MLVLTRKVGEAVQIGPDITVRVARLDGGSVRLAIEAPPSVRIFRDEVYLEIARDNQSAFLATAAELQAVVDRMRQIRSVDGDLQDGLAVESPAAGGQESKKTLVSETTVAKEPNG